MSNQDSSVAPKSVGRKGFIPNVKFESRLNDEPTLRSPNRQAYIKAYHSIEDL